MEYVIVRCGAGNQKPVFIDSRRSGSTDQRLMVEEGTHEFALCECSGDSHEEECESSSCSPVRQELEVTGTTPIKPMEVHFGC